jgi:hypothetical protein
MTREGLEAYVELAKYYEHRERRPEQAAKLVGEAIAELRRSRKTGLIPAGCTGKFQTDLSKRLARLQIKCAAPQTSLTRPSNLAESAGLAPESK